jgi:hypothetical protein
MQSGFTSKYVLTKRPEWVEKDENEGKTSGPRHNYSWFQWDFFMPLHIPKVVYLSDPKKKAA